jgi:hypothetical protein
MVRNLQHGQCPQTLMPNHHPFSLEAGSIITAQKSLSSSNPSKSRLSTQSTKRVSPYALID